jgi:hypothetical protein
MRDWAASFTPAQSALHLLATAGDPFLGQRQLHHLVPALGGEREDAAACQIAHEALGHAFQAG